MLLRLTTARRAGAALRAVRPVPLASPPPRCFQHAGFKTSAPRSASVEDRPSDFMHKLTDSPKAMESITKLMDLLEAKGVDVKSGAPPSMMQMAKIAADGKIRTATGEVLTALREAGIDVSPERMQEVLSQANFFDQNSSGKGSGEGEGKGGEEK